MKKARNAVLAGIMALGLVVASAPAAQAAEPVWSGVPARHYDMTWGGYDYVHIGSFNHSATGASCYGHSDYYKRRPVMQPWSSWRYGWIVHCVQV